MTQPVIMQSRSNNISGVGFAGQKQQTASNVSAAGKEISIRSPEKQSILNNKSYSTAEMPSNLFGSADVKRQNSEITWKKDVVRRSSQISNSSDKSVHSKHTDSSDLDDLIFGKGKPSVKHQAPSTDKPSVSGAKPASANILSKSQTVPTTAPSNKPVLKPPEANRSTLQTSVLGSKQTSSQKLPSPVESVFSQSSNQSGANKSKPALKSPPQQAVTTADSLFGAPDSHDSGNRTYDFNQPTNSDWDFGTIATAQAERQQSSAYFNNESQQQPSKTQISPKPQYHIQWADESQRQSTTDLNADSSALFGNIDTSNDPFAFSSNGPASGAAYGAHEGAFQRLHTPNESSSQFEAIPPPHQAPTDNTADWNMSSDPNTYQEWNNVTYGHDQTPNATYEYQQPYDSNQNAQFQPAEAQYESQFYEQNNNSSYYEGYDNNNYYQQEYHQQDVTSSVPQYGQVNEVYAEHGAESSQSGYIQPPPVSTDVTSGANGTHSNPPRSAGSVNQSTVSSSKSPQVQQTKNSAADSNQQSLQYLEPPQASGPVHDYNSQIGSTAATYDQSQLSDAVSAGHGYSNAQNNQAQYQYDENGYNYHHQQPSTGTGDFYQQQEQQHHGYSQDYSQIHEGYHQEQNYQDGYYSVNAHYQGANEDQTQHTFDNQTSTQQEVDPNATKLRGHAIATFAFGGRLIIVRPTRQMLYLTNPTGGVPTATEKSYPGSIKIYSVKPLLRPEVKAQVETMFGGDGPLLSSKGVWKKKKMLEYLDKMTKEEKPALQLSYYELNLWRMVRIMIENGRFGPESSPKSVATDPFIEALLVLLDIKIPEHCDEPLEMVQSLLLSGKRADACQLAVSANLWAHALIIASHVNREVYADVVSRFIMSGFSSSNPTNAMELTQKLPALKVLYSLFSGVGRESVYSFVSPADRVESLSSLHIASWRLVLLIILKNRTPGDNLALITLGQELCRLNRVEDGHLCVLSSGLLEAVSGFDDPATAICIVGADHIRNPGTFFKNLNAFHLTELLEFATTLQNNGSVLNAFPHFQAFKFWYASYLADIGYADLAQKYIGSVEYFVKSYSAGSPYFHDVLANKIRVFTDLLSNSPGVALQMEKQSSSNSWLSKLSNSFTGAALGRGIEQLMNNAVGVDNSPEQTPATKTQLFQTEPNQTNFPQADAKQQFTTNSIATSSSAPSQDAFGQSKPGSGHAIPSQPYPPVNATYAEQHVDYHHQQHVVYDGYNKSTDLSLSTEIYQHQQPSVGQFDNSSIHPQDSASVANYNVNEDYSKEIQSGYDASYTGYDATYGNSIDHNWHQNGAERNIQQQSYDQTQIPNQQAPVVTKHAPHKGFEPSPTPVNSSTDSGLNAINAAPPTSNLNQVQSVAEDEDLGFGNTSLRKNSNPKPEESNAGPEANQGETDKEATEQQSSLKDNKNSAANQSSASLLSYFGSIFAGKKTEKPETATESKAHLPSGSTFYYDTELKKWVNKSANGDAEKKEEVGPPPVVPPSTPNHLTPAQSQAPSQVPSRQASPAPVNNQLNEKAFGQALANKRSSSALGGARRSARQRYVDIINPDAPKESMPVVGSFMPPPNKIAGDMPVVEGVEPKIIMPSGGQSSFYEQFTGSTPDVGIERNPEAIKREASAPPSNAPAPSIQQLPQPTNQPLHSMGVTRSNPPRPNTTGPYQQQQQLGRPPSARPSPSPSPSPFYQQTNQQRVTGSNPQFATAPAIRKSVSSNVTQRSSVTRDSSNRQGAPPSDF